MKVLSIVFLLVALTAAVYADGAEDRNPTLCRLPIDEGDGTCLQNIKVYGYSGERNQCIQFLYSGCGGNENRFPSMSQCRGYCQN